MTDTQPYAVRITRKGVLVWIGLLFFVMGWMFVLGILVGRGTAPVLLGDRALEKELAALKAAMLKQEQDQAVAQSRGVEGQGAELEFYEALKQPPPRITERPPVKPPETRTASASPSADPRPSAPAPTPVSVARTETASKPRPPPTPTDAPTREMAPAPPANGTANDQGRFTVQVAAFREDRSADQLVAALRAKGYPAYRIRSAVRDTGEWYRVRVGAFDTRGAADAMLRKLNSDQVQGMVIGTP